MTMLTHGPKLTKRLMTETPNVNATYSSLQKWFHWLIAALILLQYLLMLLAEQAQDGGYRVQQLALIANHKSFGITVLILACLRFLLRVKHGSPALPSTMPSWQLKTSALSHAALYILIFALPITGWLMSSANAYSVSWFNLVVLPDFIEPDEDLATLFGALHELLWDVLVVIVFIHVLAALKHHWIDEDTVLTRMMSKNGVFGSLLILIISLYLFGLQITSTSTETSEPASSVLEKQKVPLSQTQQSESSLPLWAIDYQNSRIQFNGEQAGAPFSGTWQQWEGRLQFDPTSATEYSLAQANFDVSVDIMSVESNDDERDETILSSDFFDVANFPKARFQASKFQKVGENFQADGILTLKGISHPTLLTFTIDIKDDIVILRGHAKLDRHSWQIGVGDWADPTWVGSEVTVEVLVTAQVAQQ